MKQEMKAQLIGMLSTLDQVIAGQQKIVDDEKCSGWMKDAASEQLIRLQQVHDETMKLINGGINL